VPKRPALFSLLAGAACMAACGSTANGPAQSTALPGQTVTLFAAASTTAVMAKEIAAFNAQQPNVHVQGDYEGTQLLLTKLEADPSSADVFISADRRRMDDAIQRGLVSAPADLASNHLVVALPPGNPGHITSVADLAKPGVRIDLADPSVPAGSYAQMALHSIETHGDAPAGYATSVLANVVSRETDVEQVVAKVASGVVDAGIVYATDAKANAHLTALPIAAADQPVTVYPIGLTAQGHASAGARAFIAFLLGSDGQRILRAAGFAPPPSPSALSSP
jgi:molybdate transport system substrate-binding protein